MPVIARIARDDFHDPELALSRQKPSAQVTPRAELTRIQNTKSGMKVYLATVVAVFFCVVGNIYLWCKHGTIRVTAAMSSPSPDKPDKTRIDYPGHLCGRL